MQRLGEKNRQKIETESQKNKLIENSVQICTIYLIVLNIVFSCKKRYFLTHPSANSMFFWINLEKLN